MPILLYVVGALAVAIGAALIGYGIPIHEFGLGNTLILAGTVAMTGGLIVLALGVVVRELRHVAEGYGRGVARPPLRPSEAEAGQPMQIAQPMRAPPPAPARVPFPPKPKAPPQAEAPPPVPPVPSEHADELPPLPPFPLARPISTPKASVTAPPMVAAMTASAPRPFDEMFAAPALPNPDEPPVAQPEEAALRPADEADRLEADEASAEREEAAERLEAGEWTDTAEEEEAAQTKVPAPASPAGESPRELSYFDDMWPPEPPPPFRPARSETQEPELQPEPPLQPEPQPTAAAMEEPVADREPDEAAHDEPRTVPILKSGVVDGMGYTLYVDGSIEAELPQGTLRFASINELRAHLERPL